MSDAPVEAGAEGIRPTARRTGHRHFDVIVSISAIFISAVSLYVAIEHGKTERQLVAANVWPFLREIRSNGYGPANDIAFGYSNAGVGPAKVRSFEVSYQGKPVSSELDLLRKCCGLPADPKAVEKALPKGLFYSTPDNIVLRPGEFHPVTMIHRVDSAPEVPNRFDAALGQLTFRVCYCSVLDQCWSSDLQSMQAKPVGECGPPQHPYDPNGR